jgi:hypothetical protein
MAIDTKGEPGSTRNFPERTHPLKFYFQTQRDDVGTFFVSLEGGFLTKPRGGQDD